MSERHGQQGDAEDNKPRVAHTAQDFDETVKKSGAQFAVLVRPPNGTGFKAHVNDATPIAKLMRAYFTHMRMSSSEQVRLLYEGESVDLKGTVGDAGLSEGSQLFVVHQQIGGGGREDPAQFWK